MRALVTGGYGYIGGHLVKRLIELGWDVTVLDTMFNARQWEFKGKLPHIVNASVCNLDAVSRAMDGVSLVYHLAARMDYSKNLRHPIRLFQTNVIGTTVVLTEAHHAGVDNVIYTSSAAVYGNVVGAEEFGPKAPVNLYGCSKLASESVCQHFQNIGLNIKVLRPFSVWGGQHCSSVVAEFLRGVSTIYGDGTQTRDFVHISDVVEALLEAQYWEPSVYNIGTGIETTIGGLFDRLGSGKPKYLDYEFEEVYASCADMELTSQRTSWNAKVLLHELNKEEVQQLCT